MPCHKDTQAICRREFYSKKLRYWANSQELEPAPANNHGEWVQLRSDSSMQSISPPHTPSFHTAAQPLVTTSWETLSQNYPAKLLLDSSSSENWKILYNKRVIKNNNMQIIPWTGSSTRSLKRGRGRQGYLRALLPAGPAWSPLIWPGQMDPTGAQMCALGL